MVRIPNASLLPNTNHYPTQYNNITNQFNERRLMAITLLTTINIQIIDLHLLTPLTSLYGAILHNAFKRIQSALPIGMLLWDTRMFANIQGRTTLQLS